MAAPIHVLTGSNQWSRVTFSKGSAVKHLFYQNRTATTILNLNNKTFKGVERDMAIRKWQPGQLATQLWEVVEQGWYLGFTSFGGPPVHFKIVST